MSDLKEREATTRQLAAGRVDLYAAAVSWVKLAPDGTYTKNMLARKLAAQYGEDETEVRRVIKHLVDSGALVWQQDPQRRQQRKRLFRGHLNASRARVRGHAVQPVSSPAARSHLDVLYAGP